MDADAGQSQKALLEQHAAAASSIADMQHMLEWMPKRQGQVVLTKRCRILTDISILSDKVVGDHTY